MTFYTYLWLRQDGTPYYVGKGPKKRALRKGNPGIENIILQEWLCEADAFEGEKLLIAIYGRKDNGTGILRNLTDGGEGVSGRSVSSEVREKISRGHLGKPLSEEHRRKLSEAKLGKRRGPHSEEHRRKIGEAHLGKRGRVCSEETRRKMREAAKRRKERNSRGIL